jgi:hypothetical protein
VLLEQVEQAPDADAGTVLERGFHGYGAQRDSTRQGKAAVPKIEAGRSRLTQVDIGR